MRFLRVEGRPLEAALKSPFVIAGAALERITNVAVRVTLDDGSVGWGEIAVLPPLTSGDPGAAQAVIDEAHALLAGREIEVWPQVARRLRYRWDRLAAARAGVEAAVIDAVARSDRVPLYARFGGAKRELRTDVTIPICPPEEAAALARAYGRAGFDTLKVKVGRDPDADVRRLIAVHAALPAARLVVDANGGYDAHQALAALAGMRAAGVVPALLEQPVPRADWDGLGRIAREAGVPVAADESCAGLEDARRIAREGLAQVLNIKLAKTGVAEALEIVALAVRKGLGLMIGGMVETRLGMGFAAHFAAGLGVFDWIDLDTPLLLAEDPVLGGYRQDGPRLALAGSGPGHGGFLAEG